MDDRRFDALSRLFARTLSRRRAAPTAAGVVAGVVAVVSTDDAAGKKKPKKRCLKTGTRCTTKAGGKGDKCHTCCSGLSAPRANGKGRRCVCKAENAACANAKECCSGQCTGGECGPCPPTEELCSTSCVNLQTNDDHCGSCDAACGTDAGCCAGSCTDFAAPGTCGACDVSCGPNDGCCNQQCKDLQTSHQHCGDCGHACAEIEGCCGGICTDFTVPATCGACDVNCPTGEACCDQTCTDLQSNNTHCGACNIACSGNETCVDGVCQSQCGRNGPCRVFVTESTHAGDFGATLGAFVAADGFCASEAAAAGLSGIFKAWLSTSTAARDRLAHSPKPYVLLDGTTIANSWADLVDGSSLRAPINRTAANAVLGSIDVWTGTLINGERTPPHCESWSSASPIQQGISGLTSETDPNWTTASLSSCSAELRLYCFEQPPAAN